jgi:hypothetical protein
VSELILMLQIAGYIFQKRILYRFEENVSAWTAKLWCLIEEYETTAISNGNKTGLIHRAISS